MPDGFTPARLPGWPLTLGETMAARYLDMTRRDFRAGIGAGVIPAGRPAYPGGPLLWHRIELQALTAGIWGLDALAPAEHDAAGRQAAEDALHGFTPPSGRARPRRAPPLRPGRPQA